MRGWVRAACCCGFAAKMSDAPAASESAASPHAVVADADNITPRGAAHLAAYGLRVLAPSDVCVLQGRASMQQVHDAFEQLTRDGADGDGDGCDDNDDDDAVDAAADEKDGDRSSSPASRVTGNTDAPDPSAM